MKIFAEKVLLGGTVPALVFLAANPMGFDWHQRVSLALAILCGAYFLAHTIERKTSNTVLPVSIPPAVLPPPEPPPAQAQPLPIEQRSEGQNSPNIIGSGNTVNIANPNPLEGVLIPANDETPPNPCRDVPDDAVILLFGNSAAYTGGIPPAALPLPIIRVRGDNILTIGRTGDGITVSAKVFSEDGRIVAELGENRFFVNPNNYFRLERPDASSLIVYDQQRRVVLNVRFINRRTIKFLGVFHVHGIRPIVIEEDEQSIGWTVSRSCFGNTVDAVFNL